MSYNEYIENYLMENSLDKEENGIMSDWGVKEFDKHDRMRGYSAQITYKGDVVFSVENSGNMSKTMVVNPFGDNSDLLKLFYRQANEWSNSKGIKTKNPAGKWVHWYVRNVLNKSIRG